jgi:hypothetical protein
MSWEEPEFEAINMSAEIGGYYDDFGGEGPERDAAPLRAPPEGASGRDQDP